MTSFPAIKCPECRQQTFPLTVVVYAPIQCSVCLDTFSGTENKLLRCGHSVCTVCLDSIDRRFSTQLPHLPHDALLTQTIEEPPLPDALLTQTIEELPNPPPLADPLPPNALMCSYACVHPGNAPVLASAWVKTRKKWRLVCPNCRQWFFENGHDKFEPFSQ